MSCSGEDEGGGFDLEIGSEVEGGNGEVDVEVEVEVEQDEEDDDGEDCESQATKISIFGFFKSASIEPRLYASTRYLSRSAGGME